MRIVIVTDAYTNLVGGIGTSVEAQKKALEALGHEVFLFYPDIKVEVGGGKNVIVVPAKRIMSMFGAPATTVGAAEKFLREKLAEIGRVDVMHVHFELSVSLAAMRVAREMRIPLVVSMHGREDEAIKNRFPSGINTLVSYVVNRVHGGKIAHNKRVWRDDYLARTWLARNMWEMMVNHANYADYVVVPSQHFTDKLQHYGVVRPMGVVSNGVDDKKIQALGKIKVREFKEGEPLRIIWLSRLNREKRPMEFLEAVRRAGVSIKLEMYGDGAQTGEIKRYIVAHKLEKIVKLMGRVDNEVLFERMLQAHIAVLNSYGYDNQPMTLLEGVAVGLPALIVDPDMCEVMPDGGYELVKSPEIETMVAALRELSQHPERIKQMSEVMIKERGRVLQSRQIQKLLDIYSSVI